MAYRPWEYGQQLKSAQDYFDSIRTTASGVINPSTSTSSPITPIDYTTNPVDYPEGDMSTAPATYSDSELADYPSPSWMAPAANFTWGLMTSAANLAAPGLGWGVDQAKQSTTNPNYSWSTLGRNAIGGLANYGLSTVNPINNMAPSISQMAASKASGLVGNSLIDKALGMLLGDWGKKTGMQYGSDMGEEGWNYTPDFNTYTIGDLQNDPAAYDQTNLIDTVMGPVANNDYYSGNAPPGAYAGVTDLSDFAAEGFGNPMGTGNWTGSYGGAEGSGFEGGGAGSSGGDGGGSGGTVICGELLRQGYIDVDFYLTEASYGATLPQETMEGYRVWAIPVVQLMKQSKVITHLVRIISKPILNEMAHRADKAYKTSFIGSVVLSVALPVCYAIGCLKDAQEVTQNA